MTIEIERRFLLKNDKWKKFITKKTTIRQGYLSNNLDDWIIRIRSDENNFKITLKKHIKNFTCFEFEYLIPSHDGEEIMSSLTNIITKERFFLEVDKRNWIIDIFKGDNYPLEIAEIELSNEKEEFPIPSFISKEITGIKNFSNFHLTNYPFSKWKNKDLANIN